MKYFDEGTHPEDKAGMSSFFDISGKISCIMDLCV